MKKIMILGATFTQVPLIKAAKNLGYYTIVASINGDYPGLEIADEKCFVDIKDTKAVLAMAKNFNIDGIATCCMDTGIRSVGYVCEKMGLVGLSEKAAILSNDKLKMKLAFKKFNVKTPQFYKISSLSELEDAWGKLNRKSILKAVDLQASRGVFVCESLSDLKNAFLEIQKISNADYCLLEEFIEGIDIGAQAFVYNGEILFILPHNDEVAVGSANKPIGHSAPLLGSDSLISKVKDECKKAIVAIGLNNCAVNIDLIKTPNDEVYMIELTGRAGATCLPELVSIYYGIDYYKMIVELAVGRDPRHIFSKKNTVYTANASRFLMSNKSGIIKNIENKNKNDENIVLFDLYVKKGDLIKKFEDGKDRLGQVVVKGPTLNYCFEKLTNVANNILIELNE